MDNSESQSSLYKYCESEGDASKISVSDKEDLLDICNNIEVAQMKAF